VRAEGGGERGECGKDGSHVNAEAPYSLSLFLCPSVPRESTRKSVDDDQGVRGGKTPLAPAAAA